MVFTSKSLTKLTTVNSKSIATMKNLFTRLMLVAVAAMGIVACQTEPEIYVPENNADAVSVSITAGFDDTRSAFDELADGAKTYTSSWTANETVRFSLNQTGFVDMENTAEGKSATFNVSFTEGIQDAGSIYAFSPKGNYSSTPKVGGFTGSMAETYTSVYVVVPSEQTPQTNSCDEGVHLLTAKYDYEGGVPTTIDNMPFKHLLAYGKMEIKGFEGTIKSVKLTADTPLSGNSVKYFFTADEPYVEGADNNTLVLDATNVQNNVFWFGCIPAVLDDTTLTVVVTDTEENTYTKAISIPADSLEFVQGQVSSFSVNFTGISADVVEPTIDPTTLAYTLVTDVNQLYDGAYVIVASGYDDSVAVMGATNSNGNNRPQVEGSHRVSDDVLYYTDAAILRLGVDGANYTLYDINEEGYLCATSTSSNHLKTKSTLDDFGKWSISIGGEPYAATVKSTGVDTTNWMRYNTSSKLFSCYSSGQADIYLYVGVDPSTVVKKTALATPTVTATVDVNKVTVSWEAVDNAANYTVTFDGKETTTADYEVVFEDLKYDTAYTVSVVANPADDSELYYSSEAGTASVTTGADPRVVLGTPELVAGAITESSITVSWEAVANASGYVVTKNGEKTNLEADVTTYTFENLSPATTYTITIYAQGDNISYINSAVDSIELTTTGTATVSTYTKIISADELSDGKYIIVYEDSSNAYVFSGVDAANGNIAATISDNTISGTFADGEVTIAAMEGGYSLKVTNGYMSGTSGSNKLNFNKSTAQLNTITFKEDGTAHIVSNTSVLRFNSASGNMRFRYFKSDTYTNQKAVYLYKKN